MYVWEIQLIVQLDLLIPHRHQGKQVYPSYIWSSKLRELREHCVSQREISGLHVVLKGVCGDNDLDGS